MHEALHLAPDEQKVILEIFTKVNVELSRPIDRHSKTLIVSNVEQFAYGLAGPGINHGAGLDEFIDKVFTELFINDQEEAGFGPTANIKLEINGKPQTSLFLNSVSRFPVEVYSQN